MSISGSCQVTTIRELPITIFEIAGFQDFYPEILPIQARKSVLSNPFQRQNEELVALLDALFCKNACFRDNDPDLFTGMGAKANRVIQAQFSLRLGVFG